MAPFRQAATTIEVGAQDPGQVDALHDDALHLPTIMVGCASGIADYGPRPTAWLSGQ